MKGIKYMLGLEPFSFRHVLDHPLWQMRVKHAIETAQSRRTRAVNRAREAIHMWQYRRNGWL